MDKVKTIKEIINQPVNRKIVDLLKKNKYYSFGDIIREIGLSYQEGLKYVIDLKNKGIITKTKIPPYYTLNEAYKDI